MKSLLMLACLMCVSHLLSGQSKPEDHKLVIENDNVRVYEYDSKPGKDVCGLGKHSHPEHLTVMLTDANVTITSPDGKVTSAKMKAGTTFWSEAESHTVINSGASEVKCQLVELKKRK